MFKNHASILLLASSLLLLPAAATAADKAMTTPTASKGGAVTANSLMERYGTMAGSPDNAKSLVNGLRAKEEVVLVGPAVMPTTCKFPCRGGPTSGTVTVRFMPSTDAMGWGNVDIALALAEADLKAKNVSAPKPEHVKFALMGGSLMTPTGNVDFDGILKMRADGRGWGEIAKSLGFELK